MKLYDIANLLAKKINQAHYIKHYLNEVFIEGFKKGVANNDKFAIVFTEWLIKKCDFQKHGCWLYKGMEMTQKELLEVFKNDIESNKH